MTDKNDKPSLREQIANVMRSKGHYGVAETAVLNPIMQLFQAHEEAAVREAKIDTAKTLLGRSLNTSKLQVAASNLGEDQLQDYVTGYKIGWEEASEMISDFLVQFTHPQAGESEGK